MVKFLINRPVAVFMITLAFLLLGLAASNRIPTSLMPDIPIPYISVQITYPNQTARELETNVVRSLRNQLLQVSHLKEIQSETRDGSSVINLHFNYGTSTDLAFIETNEKIDASLNYLPKEMDRPKVIKASATDIPVINLTVQLKNSDNTTDFLALSEFCQSVLKKRIEQLPEIAVADISGLAKTEVLITPKKEKLTSLDIELHDLIQAIKDNNFEYGNILVHEGIYQYNFKFLNPVKSLADIENIYLNIHNKLFQLKDLATVKMKPQTDRGLVYVNGKRAVVLSVIKQADASIYKLNKTLKSLTDSFKKDYPDLVFLTNQDQSKLLKLSINNLKSSLLIGSILAVLILFFFLKDAKSPFIIAISIPVSLLVSVLLMYLTGMSVNIISLSGLILGVGMMIDNSIIVIDNITQKIDAGKSLETACIEGTNEIITPLISSVLTTVAVFVPLVFLSGITGALFYDQASAVAIGLGSSLIVSIILIPVLYKQLKGRSLKIEKWLSLHFKTQHIEDRYEKGFVYFNKHKGLLISISAAGILLFIILMQLMPYSRLPKIKQNEAVIEIDWNENINVNENQNRINKLFKGLDHILMNYSQTGEQQFVFRQDNTKDITQANIYVQASSVKHLETALQSLIQKINKTYPKADYALKEPKNVFQYLFGKDKPELTAKVFSRKILEVPNESHLDEIYKLIGSGTQSKVPLKQTLYIEILYDKMMLYDVNYNRLFNELKTGFDSNFIDNLKTSKTFIPIKINYNRETVNQMLSTLFVKNNKNEQIPLRNLIKLVPSNDYKIIKADRSGEFLDFNFKHLKNPKVQISSILENFKNQQKYDVRFSGSFFDLKEIQSELIIVVLISFLLLYFIMAAQFESLWLPLIILFELPIDIGGALLLLWLFGGTINVMSAIGIIVMSGIVINDSILKIHTINLLHHQGMSIEKAIKEGGKLRLKPILMTSLTTILALLPFLFLSGLGAELQRPLALTVIGGLLLGTFISLYFIPMAYMMLLKIKKV